MSLQKQFVRVKSIKKVHSSNKRCKHAWTLLKYKPPKKLAQLDSRPETTSSNYKPLALDDSLLQGQKQQLDSSEDPASMMIKYFNASNWPIGGASSARSSISCSSRPSSDICTEANDSYKFKRRLLSRYTAEQDSAW